MAVVASLLRILLRVGSLLRGAALLRWILLRKTASRPRRVLLLACARETSHVHMHMP